MPDKVGTIKDSSAFRKKTRNDIPHFNDTVNPNINASDTRNFGITAKSEEVSGVHSFRHGEQMNEKSCKSKEIKALVAIGVSTGGPKALQEVIKFIPQNVPAAILIVQHMPTGFTKTLAERLNAISSICVKEAEDGEIVQPGHAYIAPGDYHMKVVMTKDKSLKIKLSKEPPIGGLRPSVNVMMNSVAETRFPKVIGVIMTGMGSDGSEGIVNIKQYNNGIIIAQDEETSVVYGMPRAAVKTGCVDLVVPLNDISKQIVKYVGVE